MGTKKKLTQFDEIVEEHIETKSPKKNKKRELKDYEVEINNYMSELNEKEKAYTKKKTSKNRDKEKYEHWDKWN